MVIKKTSASENLSGVGGGEVGNQRFRTFTALKSGERELLNVFNNIFGKPVAAVISMRHCDETFCANTTHCKLIMLKHPFFKEQVSTNTGPRSAVRFFKSLSRSFSNTFKVMYL